MKPRAWLPLARSVPMPIMDGMEALPHVRAAAKAIVASLVPADPRYRPD
ncbi:MAG: hypothetical protein JWM90_1038 [Thermoleophilia bacterium]|nr:hypothetical protein [Thermoleophilia bacterium]